MGTNIDPSGTYIYAFVPIIEYSYNEDGALTQKLLLNSNGDFLYDNEETYYGFEFPEYYTHDINAYKFEYHKTSKREYNNVVLYFRESGSKMT